MVDPGEAGGIEGPPSAGRFPKHIALEISQPYSSVKCGLRLQMTRIAQAP